MLHRYLKGDESPGSPNKYRKFGRLITRKIVKFIATRCLMLVLKCTIVDSQRLSLCFPFVRLCLWWNLALTSHDNGNTNKLVFHNRLGCICRADPHRPMHGPRLALVKDFNLLYFCCRLGSMVFNDENIERKIHAFRNSASTFHLFGHRSAVL